MYARMATYSFSGDAHELAARAERGILPIFKSQPGFAAYSVAVGDGEILSLSVWDSRADAEAGRVRPAANLISELKGQERKTPDRKRA